MNVILLKKVKGLYRSAVALVFILLLLPGCEFISSISKPSEQALVVAEQKGDLTVEPAKPLISPYEQNAVSVPDDVVSQFQQALQLMGESQWQQAEAILAELIAQQPTLSGPVLNLAIIKQQQGDAATAERYYQQAINLNSNNVAAYNRYAIFLRQRGDFKEAEQFYQQALSVWPHSAATHRNIGILYDLYLGRLTDAQHHYQQYIQLREQAPGFKADKAYKQVKGWGIDTARRLSKRGQ